MECFQCGKPIDKGSLRCPSCHFDMLAVDISQRPLPYTDGKLGIVGNFCEAAGLPRPIPGAPGYLPAAYSHHEQSAETQQRATRARWLLIAFPGLMIAIELLLSLGR